MQNSVFYGQKKIFFKNGQNLAIFWPNFLKRLSGQASVILHHIPKLQNPSCKTLGQRCKKIDFFRIFRKKAKIQPFWGQISRKFCQTMPVSYYTIYKNCKTPDAKFSVLWAKIEFLEKTIFKKRPKFCHFWPKCLENVPRQGQSRITSYR